MNDEIVYLDKGKIKNFRKKPQVSLSIPDPADLFKRKMLKRPPSVPIFSRRLSSEPGAPIAEEQIPRHQSKSSFKSKRRYSVPDQIDVIPEKSHRKCESKVKVAQKALNSKPPLYKKQKKLGRAEQKKNYCRENSQSAPHMRKIKKNVIKFDIPHAEIISLTEDKRKFEVSTPNKAIQKISDLNKVRNKELKKIQKELVQKTAENPKILKFEKHVKHHCNENKSLGVGNKKMKKCKTPGIRNDCSPDRVLKKKMDIQDKVFQFAFKTKNEPWSQPCEPKVRKKPKEKKVSQINELEKILKKSAKSKKKLKKPKCLDEWVEHSFSAKPELKLQDSFGLNQETLSENFTSMAPSTNCNFQSPPIEQVYSKNSSSPSLNCVIIDKPNLKSLQKKKVKIIKKPFILNEEENKENRKKLNRDHAASKIQALVKGFLHRKKLNIWKNVYQSENSQNQSLIFELDSEKSSEEVEFKQIIDEMQRSVASSFEEHGFPEHFLEEPNDESVFKAPKPIEVVEKLKAPKTTSLSLNELGRRIKAEQKTLEEVEKSFKEIENLEYLDTLMKNRASIDELRNRDLLAIHSITNKTDSEAEIYEIFQKIINRRYEKINSMFDENIKAVKEALANTVLTDESILKNEENFQNSVQDPKNLNEISFSEERNWQKIEESKVEGNELRSASISTSCNSFKVLISEKQVFKNFEKDLNKLTSLESVFPESKRTPSPEGIQGCSRFPSAPNSLFPVFFDPEPYAALFLQEHFTQGSNNIIWMDEVAMPNNIDFTELIIDAVLSDLNEDIYKSVFNSLFIVSPESVLKLSEELIQAILAHDIQEHLDLLRSQYNEENVFAIIQKIFTKTQGVIITELLKPLEKDPLMALAELQETEIGTGFIPDEKYLMLNIEAFQDDLYSPDPCVRIFNSMVFDCINDCLEKLIVKEDLPWAMVKYKTVKVRTPEQAIHYIADRLLKFSEVRAGSIENAKIEVDDCLIRDSDALKIMASEIEDDEVDWVKYEKEESQSLLDVADLVLEHEIEYIVEVLFNMKLV